MYRSVDEIYGVARDDLDDAAAEDVLETLVSEYGYHPDGEPAKNTQRLILQGHGYKPGFIDLSIQEGLLKLELIEVTKERRREGLASLMLHHILTIADQNDVPVVLEVAPPEERMQSIIETWYEDNGFILREDLSEYGEVFMIRPSPSMRLHMSRTREYEDEPV